MKRIHISKTILTTGTSSGFGRDTAETLAERIAGYGELGGIPTKIAQTLAESFKGENAKTDLAGE